MTDSQPTPTPSPHAGLRERAAFVKRKLTTRHGWIGDYDYAWLCLPRLPFTNRTRRTPPFYALDAELPLVLAIFTGFQHALAMLAGMHAVPSLWPHASIHPLRQVLLPRPSYSQAHSALTARRRRT